MLHSDVSVGESVQQAVTMCMLRSEKFRGFTTSLILLMLST